MRCMRCITVFSLQLFPAAYIQVEVYWNDQWEWTDTENTRVIDSILATLCLPKWCSQWWISVLITNSSMYWDTLSRPGPSHSPQHQLRKASVGRRWWRGITIGKNISFEVTAKGKERCLSQAFRVTVACILISFLRSGKARSLQDIHRVAEIRATNVNERTAP